MSYKKDEEAIVIENPDFEYKHDIIVNRNGLDSHSFWINLDDFDKWFKETIEPLNKKLNPKEIKE